MHSTFPNQGSPASRIWGSSSQSPSRKPAQPWESSSKSENDHDVEKKQYEEIILNLQQELENERAKNRVLSSKQKFKKMETTITEATNNSTVTRIMNFSPDQPIGQLIKDSQSLNFDQIDQAYKTHTENASEIKKDLFGFNDYTTTFNRQTLAVLRMIYAKELSLNARQYPSQIQEILEKIEDFKNRLLPILQTNFLTFEPEKLPTLQAAYEELKKEFATNESTVLQLEADSLFSDFLLKLQGTVKGVADSDNQAPLFHAIIHSDTSLKFDLIESDELKGDVLENYKNLKEKQSLAYKRLLQHTCENWFFVITETILLKNTLQCLGETIGLFLPIEELGARTAKFCSKAKKALSSNTESTKKIGATHLTHSHLSEKLNKLEPVFQECVDKKIKIEDGFNSATKKLEDTNGSLISRLKAQTQRLEKFYSDPQGLKTKTEDLQKKMKDQQILLSSDLNATRQEILKQLPLFADYLDQIDKIVNPPKTWRETASRAYYRGRFYQIINQPTKISTKEVPTHQSSSIQPPADEDPDTKSIPTVKLSFDLKIKETI